MICPARAGKTRHFFSDARKEMAKEKGAKEGALTAAPSCGISPVAEVTSEPYMRRSARVVPDAENIEIFCGRHSVAGLRLHSPASRPQGESNGGPQAPLVGVEWVSKGKTAIESGVPFGTSLPTFAVQRK